MDGLLIDHLAWLAALRAQPTLAAQLLGCADALHEQAGRERRESERRAVAQTQRLVQGTLGEAEVAHWRRTGRALDEDTVLARLDRSPSGGEV